ncbi:hypothetical protein OG875_20470 [Streptomyces sp. NBC_01498]|uniref:hypothetical protein n=1 Tax=Streptomyces sp. NBC_01498 TaxID=2975870 RepID=UPI002E7B1D72|nr:hypothetical protein [Streptomyces sp. NBC_01498]WTL26728.1 hypothetical protein OG875_20470 [Streptomyces sp. NBC_01498]
MRTTRLRPALVTGVLGAAGAVGVTTGTIVPASLPAPTANAAVADAGAGDGPGRGPGADRQPTCGKVSERDFPLRARIHDGPGAYVAGGGPGTWSVDLVNGTGETCHNIHPVIVLADRHRSLTDAQVRLQLTDDKGRWRAMSLETSDEHETIGVLEGDFAGFAVPARGTVTVRVRLAFTDAAEANTVVANAATVQRRGGDGDWVGESNAYRFSVDDAAGNRGRDRQQSQDQVPEPDPDPGSGDGPRTPAPARTPLESTESTESTERTEDSSASGAGRTPAPTLTSTPNSGHREDTSLPPGIGSLADTGGRSARSVAGPAIAAAALLFSGAALLLRARHLRNRP